MTLKGVNLCRHSIFLYSLMVAC